MHAAFFRDARAAFARRIAGVRWFGLGLLGVGGAIGVVGAACTTSAEGPPSAGEGPFFTRTGGNYDAIAIAAKDGTGTLETGRFRAFISDANSVCANGARRQGATVLGIDTTGTAPGTFPATFQIARNDSACNGTAATNTGSGTVTITSVSTTVVEGTFDATLDADAGTLTGSFNVPLCPALDVTTCKP